MKKVISLTLTIGLIFFSVWAYLEPQVVEGANADDVITVTQAVSQEITITAPANVTMSSAIPGITGNPGSPRTGSATWTVKASNSIGFTLSLKASASPAMQLDATYQFADYTPAAGGTPDYTWASPAASAAEFGYTVEPETLADTDPTFKDDGTVCSAGALQTADRCWYNFSTSYETVVNRSTNTDSTGEDEVVKFQTESNAKFLKEGSYVATITATASEN